MSTSTPSSHRLRTDAGFGDPQAELASSTPLAAPELLKVIDHARSRSVELLRRQEIVG